MSKSKTIADYEDAVRRITNSHVSADATTRAEVRAALNAAGAPQITPEVIDGIVANLLTEDRVLEAIQATGEVPSEGEIDALVAVSDDYNQNDRQASVEREVRETVATIEDIDRAVRERRQQKGERPLFREDVETAIQEVASRKQLLGQTADQVTATEAREEGAPRERDFRKVAAQTIATADQVIPADVVEGTRAKTPASVIRSKSGDVVAVTGGPSDKIGREIAAQYGAEYMDTQDVENSMGTSGVGSRVDVTLRGQKIGEVDV